MRSNAFACSGHVHTLVEYRYILLIQAFSRLRNEYTYCSLARDGYDACAAIRMHRASDNKVPTPTLAPYTGRAGASPQLLEDARLSVALVIFPHLHGIPPDGGRHRGID